MLQQKCLSFLWGAGAGAGGRDFSPEEMPGTAVRHCLPRTGLEPACTLTASREAKGSWLPGAFGEGSPPTACIRACAQGPGQAMLREAAGTWVGPTKTGLGKSRLGARAVDLSSAAANGRRCTGDANDPTGAALASCHLKCCQDGTGNSRLRLSPVSPTGPRSSGRCATRSVRCHSGHPRL